MRHAVFLIALGSAAVAEPAALIDATDPQRILQIASSHGSAYITTDDVGDPLIIGAIDGLSYRLEFYGCDGDGGCTDLLFKAAYDAPDVELDDLGAWNRDHRYGKAAFGPRGVVIVEQAVNLQGGVSEANLDSSFDWWKEVLVEFTEFIE